MTDISAAERIADAWNREPSRRPQLAADPDLPTALWKDAARWHPFEASTNPALGLAALDDPSVAADLGSGLRDWIRTESRAGRWGSEQTRAIHDALARIPNAVAEAIFAEADQDDPKTVAALLGIFFSLLDDERPANAVRDAMKESRTAMQVAAWLLNPERRRRLLELFRHGRLPAAPLFRLSDPPRIFNPDLSPAQIIARAALADTEAGLDVWLDTDDPDIADGVADEIRWKHAEKPPLELLESYLQSHAVRYPANPRMVQRWLEPPKLDTAIAYVNATDRESASNLIESEYAKESFFRVVAQRNACGEIGRWSDLIQDALEKEDHASLIRTTLAGACRRQDWPIELRAVIAFHLQVHDGGKAMQMVEQEPVDGDGGLGLRLGQFIKRLSQEKIDALYGARIRDDEAAELPVDIAVLRGLREVAIRRLQLARR